MTKLKSPIFSLGAHGSVADALTFQRIHHTDIVRNKPVPRDARTFPQLAHRFIYQDIVYMWHELTAAEKRQYEIDARRRKITAFNLFMSEELGLASHLLAYYPLNEGIGSIAIDFSPKRANATIYGATWTDGVYGKGLLFDGSDDYVPAPPAAYFTGLTQFTIELAFILSAPLERGYLFYLFIWPEPYIFVSRWANASLSFRLKTTDGNFSLVKNDTFPNAGVPYRLSLAWTGSLLRAVLNGSQVDTEPTTGTFPSFTPSLVYLGNRDAKDLALFGVLDDFRFYDVALTLAQQQRHTERSARP